MQRRLDFDKVAPGAVLTIAVGMHLQIWRMGGRKAAACTALLSGESAA